LKSELKDLKDATENLRHKFEVEVAELKKQLEDAKCSDEAEMQEPRDNRVRHLAQLIEQLGQNDKVSSY